MNRLSMGLLISCCAVWALVAGSAEATAPLPAAAEHSATPATAYVESSAGLDVPALESGRTELEIGDVNGDGHLDIVSIGDHGSPFVNTDQHGIMVWFGDGSGGWTVTQNGVFGYGGVALGDVNNDGYVDVGYGMHHNYAGSDFGDQLIEVALGDGSGVNWQPWDDGLATDGETWGMFGTDFADVDNDGDLDIASISFGCCNGWRVYLNQGDGTWTPGAAVTGGNSNMLIEFGDVNGDGNADLAAAHQAGTVYLGDGTGGFAVADGNLPPAGSLGRRGVALGDVTGNGRDELAFCNSSGGIEVWAWIGPGQWQSLSGALPASGPCQLTQLRDMNVDGHVDLVGAGDGYVRVWAGDGSGGWTVLATIGTPSPGTMEALRVGGDADHNGFPDIAFVSEEGGFFNQVNHLRFFKEASAPAALTIAPIYPTGGETIVAGSVREVVWVTAVPDGAPSVVSIAFSADGPDGPWRTVASGLPNSGQHQVRVPADVPMTDNAFLRFTVSTASDSAVAVTAAPFSIEGVGR